MIRVVFISLLIVGCVPYQQQLADRQKEIDDFHREVLSYLDSDKIIFSSVAYQNQVKFENTNIRDGYGTTISRLLPRNNCEGKCVVSLIDEHLLIPVNAYREVHDQSEYFLVADEDYSVDEFSNFHVNLIFVESGPENILWGRKMKIPTTRFYAFDLLQLQRPETDKIIINLHGLEGSIEYRYR